MRPIRSGSGSVSASRNTSTSPVARCAPYQQAQVFPVQPSGTDGAAATSTPAAMATATKTATKELLDGLRVQRPLARAPEAAARLHRHARCAGRAGVPAAGGGIGRPAFPPARHGGTQDRGAPARAVEPVPSQREVGCRPVEPRLRAALRADGTQPAHGGGDELG